MQRKDAFRERERGLEEAYFRAADAKLLEKLRAQATLGDLALALKEKLQVDDPDLLRRIGELGVTQETGAAFLLAPLVQVAWADGEVAGRERDTVLDLAADRGIEPGSPARALLIEWLDRRPPNDLFDTSMAAIRAGLSVLPRDERDERVRRYVEACKRVARASGAFAGLLGMPGTVSSEEAELLDVIAGHLRGNAG